jgi:hypothetical protein
MKKRVTNIDEKISHLLIDSYQPEDNAYNHGLTHAGLLFNGVDVETIKEMQNRMRNSVR